MLDKLKETIKWKAGPYDHIVWYGTCPRCNSRRYLFHKELRRLGKGNYADMRGEKVECKGGRCKGKVKLRGRISNFRATHLNNIKRREA